MTLFTHRKEIFFFEKWNTSYRRIWGRYLICFRRGSFCSILSTFGQSFFKLSVPTLYWMEATSSLSRGYQNSGAIWDRESRSKKEGRIAQWFFRSCKIRPLDGAATIFLSEYLKVVHWCDSKVFRTWHYSLSLLYCLSWFIEMPLGYKPPTSIFLPRWGVQLPVSYTHLTLPTNREV